MIVFTHFVAWGFPKNDQHDQCIKFSFQDLESFLGHLLHLALILYGMFLWNIQLLWKLLGIVELVQFCF